MPSQRERLIQAMIELSARAGYQTATSPGQLARRGFERDVLRAVPDKDRLSSGAYRTVNEQSFRQDAARDGSGDWAIATRDAFAELLHSVESEPSGARVPFIEARAATRLREEIARALDEFEAGAESLLAHPPKDTHDPGCPGACAGGSGARPWSTRHLRTKQGPPAAAHR